jgi:hypothetical protein
VKLDVKGVLALLVVIGAFVIIGAPYIASGRPPDHDVLLFANGAQLLVLGWYFGHFNGTQTALTNSALQLAQQAIEKRAAPTLPLVATLPATPVPGPLTPAG